MRRSTWLFDNGNTATMPFREFLRDVGIPGTTLVEIDTALQNRFFQKNPDGSAKERWELKEAEVGCPADQIKKHLAACGFINETTPSRKLYTYAAWPGALVTRAAVRLQDLIRAWDSGMRWEQTIVFGGKRPLQPDKESFSQCCGVVGITEDDCEIDQAEKEWRLHPPQTELEMMIFLFAWAFAKNGRRHGMQNISTIFVDAPMKPAIKEGGPPIRPNTEDTIVEWLKNGPKTGSMLLSSGAPYGIGYG